MCQQNVVENVSVLQIGAVVKAYDFGERILEAKLEGFGVYFVTCVQEGYGPLVAKFLKVSTFGY